MKEKLATIDAYIQSHSTEVRNSLVQLRKVILLAAPTAIEKISYGIPTFYLNSNLVHFAGYKRHIGLYPGPSGIKAFSRELSIYKSGKGSVQFPIDAPLPLQLISDIVKFPVKKNLAGDCTL